MGEAELKKLNNDMKLNESEIDAEKKCRKEMNAKVIDAESEICKLRNENDIEKLPNISALEEDAEKAREDIAECNSNFEIKDKILKDAESDRDNFQLKYNDCIEKLQQDYDHYTKKVGQYNNELTQCRKKEAEDEGEIRNLRDKAENMMNNPPSAEQLRRPEAIFREIEGLEKSLLTQKMNLEPVDTVIEKLRKSKTIYNSKKIKVNRLTQNVRKLEKMLGVREEGFGLIQASVGRRVQHSFNVRMSARRYSGFLEFDHRNRTLELTVDTEGGNILEMSAPKRNLRTLSGGEKSYSTTALILALWESMQPPFRVLDEFDVFMDMVNRTVALGQIISYAKETRKFQYIFLTPLNIPVDDDEVSVVVLEKS